MNLDEERVFFFFSFHFPALGLARANREVVRSCHDYGFLMRGTREAAE